MSLVEIEIYHLHFPIINDLYVFHFEVMYMYYLLGHRIMDSPLSLEDRQQMADNTFILALDGDSKFEPEAALRLLQLMKQKSDIGCACGRIHPIGRGTRLLLNIFTRWK